MHSLCPSVIFSLGVARESLYAAITAEGDSSPGGADAGDWSLGDCFYHHLRRTQSMYTRVSHLLAHEAM